VASLGPFDLDQDRGLAPVPGPGQRSRRTGLLHFFWQFVTDLGDSAVTLPLAGVAVVFLLLSHWPRAALALLSSVAAAAIGIAGLKLFFGACGRALVQPALVNPSGHAALGTAVYGALALLAVRVVGPGRRIAAYAVFALTAGAIAASRVALQAHGGGEVLMGLAVGLGALALFRVLVGTETPVRLNLRRLIAAVILVLILMHGSRWPIEERIREMDALIQSGIPHCA
jgi:membrane-associated phospholipid phosphatase